MAALSELKPQKVFEYFEKICSVPHGSGNTKQVSDLCAGFAKELGLKYHQDESNNLVIWKDASSGYEMAEPVVLQGHIDMVCAKTDDCGKDMAADGLDLMTDGQWLWADQTSLGADDGIAVAMIFAVLADSTLPHPPIEVLLTVDEEVGMDGAKALDCSILKGRRLLNLDCEEEGVFVVSCSGGVCVDCCIPGNAKPLDGETGYCVSVSGLLGGHSGVVINKGRASANQLLGRVLYSVMERIPGLRLADMRGGRFDNVICSRCDAKVAVPLSEAAAFETLIQEFEKTLKNEYAGSDGGVTLSWEKGDLSAAMETGTTSVMLHTLLAMPQGVEAMSADFPDVVQTSSNLGVMAMGADGLHFTLSVRSSIASQKAMLVQRIHAIVGFAGGTAADRSAYPGWPYRRESPFRDIVLNAYRDLTGKAGVVEATHSGLECGLFLEKVPGLDVVSMGPELRDVHSVQERLSIPSTERVYGLLCEVLKRCKGPK